MSDKELIIKGCRGVIDKLNSVIAHASSLPDSEESLKSLEGNMRLASRQLEDLMDCCFYDV